MEVTFETQKSDYTAYILWFCFYRNLSWRIPVSLLIAIYVGAMGSSGENVTHSWDVFFMTSLAFWLTQFIIAACLPYFIRIVRFNLKSKKLAFPVNATIVVHSEGLSIENEKNHFVKWSEIKRLINSPNYIHVRSSQSSFLIPKRYFTSTEASKLFFEKINTGHGKHLFFHPKPNYNWGFLCLIPLIGFFNGIVMIVKGISKYKDIKYTLIGIGGVLFTVVIYGGMFYEARFGTVFNPSTTALTRNELNTIVKSIEFYKLQHDHYPDSLQEINEGGMAFIYDTMDRSDMFSSHKAKLYNYKRIGNKYTIFSSGFDGIPHTSDDVYPTIDVSDTSKFGLIKE